MGSCDTRLVLHGVAGRGGVLTRKLKRLSPEPVGSQDFFLLSRDAGCLGKMAMCWHQAFFHSAIQPMSLLRTWKAAANCAIRISLMPSQ
jgi:hypothetical protein